MTAPNHIVGGVVFTGFMSSILGWNIFSNSSLMFITLLGSLLPDIDTPRSLFGRMFYFSKFINRKVGHRTLTHSLIFIFVISSLMSLINTAWFSVDHLASTFAIALF